MMPTSKDFHTQCKLYWDWYWNEFKPKLTTGFFPFNISFPEKKQHRKLKRNVFYPHEFNFHKRNPKHHNKLHHIRPTRRATTLLEKEIIKAYDREEAEIKYYINHKKHIYYD